jgi:hypothetical protein
MTPPDPYEGYSAEQVLDAWDEVRRGAPCVQPPIIDVYRSRWAAARAHGRANPMVYVSLGVVGALAAPAVFIVGMLGLVIWYSIFG